MKRIFTSIALVCAILSPLTAKTVRGYESSSDNILCFEVDSIDYRSDLTRVYGKVKGRPHTSNRIDLVQLIGTGASASSTDIDGVDFRRYFQWEDDGMISVEIDFPVVKESQGVQLLFTTAHGQSTTTAKKVSKKHK